NDGLLHFLDTASGEEVSAVIPASLWKPNNIARDVLRNINDQPATNVPHRVYLDGEIRLFHYDSNGDQIINNNEKAYLVFGLGRGGRAYYMINVSQFNGVPDATNNPPLPIFPTAGTAFQELQATWAAPWLGIGM